MYQTDSCQKCSLHCLDNQKFTMRSQNTSFSTVVSLGQRLTSQCESTGVLFQYRMRPKYSDSPLQSDFNGKKSGGLWKEGAGRYNML